MYVNLNKDITDIEIELPKNPIGSTSKIMERIEVQIPRNPTVNTSNFMGSVEIEVPKDSITNAPKAIMNTEAQMLKNSTLNTSKFVESIKIEVPKDSITNAPDTPSNVKSATTVENTEAFKNSLMNVLKIFEKVDTKTTDNYNEKETSSINSNISSSLEELYRIDDMDGYLFENWCTNLLKKNGFVNIAITPKSNDQGVDILAQKDGVKYAIQCKCYSSNLGNKPIQEVHTGKDIYRCHVGVVMTNRYFTQGAKKAAEATGTLLWDRNVLREMLIKCESL